MDENYELDEVETKIPLLMLYHEYRMYKLEDTTLVLSPHEDK
jgi:hypothetical protein